MTDVGPVERRLKIACLALGIVLLSAMVKITLLFQKLANTPEACDREHTVHPTNARPYFRTLARPPPRSNGSQVFIGTVPTTGHIGEEIGRIHHAIASGRHPTPRRNNRPNSCEIEAFKSLGDCSEAAERLGTLRSAQDQETLSRHRQFLGSQVPAGPQETRPTCDAPCRHILVSEAGLNLLQETKRKPA